MLKIWNILSNIPLEIVSFVHLKWVLVTDWYMPSLIFLHSNFIIYQLNFETPVHHPMELHLPVFFVVGGAMWLSFVQ